MFISLSQLEQPKRKLDSIFKSGTCGTDARNHIRSINLIDFSCEKKQKAEHSIRPYMQEDSQPLSLTSSEPNVNTNPPAQPSAGCDTGHKANITLLVRRQRWTGRGEIAQGCKSSPLSQLDLSKRPDEGGRPACYKWTQ